MTGKWRKWPATLAGLIALSAAPPGVPVRHWDVPAIASPEWESHPAVDPRSGDLWLVRSDRKFAGWRLLVARCGPHGWSAPVSPSIAAPGLEADPWFTPDGSQLYFISSRRSGATVSAALDIWLARRRPDGEWSAPERLPEPVNSDAAEWFPRPAGDGWLYFGSSRPGGFGGNDIWRARKVKGRWQVENAGPAVNGREGEYELQPSPDGRWALLSTDSGLYRLKRGKHGWAGKRRYGPEVNVNGTEIGPLILADGHSFLYSRDSGKDSGELYVAGTGKPPVCADSRPG